MAFVSFRKSIKWGDDDAKEDTDTIVLTSRNRYFTDVRILESARLGNTGEISIEDIDWAFAGLSTNTAAEYTHLNGGNVLVKPSHTIWTHWIDNKTAEEVQDEGDMYDLPDGDVLEKGAMINPVTGKMSSYEELWTDLEAPAGGFSSYVLTLDTERARGMIIRIGPYIQGVHKSENDTSIGRWKYDSKDGSWYRTLKFGCAEFPHEALFGVHAAAPVMRERSTIMVKNDAWTCVEAFN